eukprot:g131.t1
MNRIEALDTLGFDYVDTNPCLKKIRKAFRREALKCHPDKDSGEDAAKRFREITRALEVLEEELKPPSGGVPPSSTSMATKMDNHKTSDFDPRRFDGSVNLEAVDDVSVLKTLSAVWQCTECPEKSSVCCRIKPRKHRCLCGHKLSDHNPENKFACAHKDCKCSRFQFHVQLNGWQTRCGNCKHKPEDHAPYGKRRCCKCIGKHARPCECPGYRVAWVCNCDHSWSSHKTVFVRTKYASMARDWVVCGVSKAVQEEAKWKREEAARRVASKLSARAREIDDDLDTTEFVRRTIEELGLSDAALSYVQKDLKDRRSGLIASAKDDDDDDDGRVREEVRSKLRLIYKAYAPGNISKIPRLLAHYSGREQRILRKVMKKYNVSSMATVEASLRRREKGSLAKRRGA